MRGGGVGPALRVLRAVLAGLALCVTGPGAVAAQAPDSAPPAADTADATAPGLGDEAERARRLWAEHLADSLVARTPAVVVSLPGAEPAGALGARQATALLADYLEPAEEVEVRVERWREVGAGRGYVELRRRYRLGGTGEPRDGRVLLSYRLVEGAWRLAELRVLE